MASRFWQRYSQSPLLRDIADKAAYFTKAAAAIYIVREHLLEFTVCVGPSMMPTFNPRGDVAILEHVSVWTHNIKVGEMGPDHVGGGGLVCGSLCQMDEAWRGMVMSWMAGGRIGGCQRCWRFQSSVRGGAMCAAQPMSPY